MTESFGARMREQRERQQIALTDIADRTKINRSLLEGLERDDLSNWPAGIFRRSFLRVYAQAIGLEPESVVREFLEVHPDPTDVVAAPPGDESPAQRPPTRLGCLIGSAISSLRRSRNQVVQDSDVVLESDAVQHSDAVWQSEAVPQSEAIRQSEAVQQSEPVHESEVVQGSVSASDPVPDDLDVVGKSETAEPALSDVAHLCTELCRVLETRDVAPLLKHFAEMLDAIGLIVWVWDPQRTALKPALAHGYSEEVLAKLPKVRRETDNATAASFRSAQTHIVNGNDLASGAVVVPLMTPAGCTGVLAVELRHGAEQRESVRALATIFAAQLATFVGSAPLAEAVNA
jgi:transcriptional regulator with XRE-family HTH domain